MLDQNVGLYDRCEDCECWLEDCTCFVFQPEPEFGSASWDVAATLDWHWEVRQRDLYRSWAEKVRPWIRRDVSDLEYLAYVYQQSIESEGYDGLAHRWDVSSLICQCCCEEHYTRGCWICDPLENGRIDDPGDVMFVELGWARWIEADVARRNDPLVILASAGGGW